MRNQEGLTLTGFILWAVLGVIVLLLAVKIGPPYMEFMSLKKQMKIVAEDPALQSAPLNSIGGAFMMRASVENITSLGPDDLVIEKVDGKVVLAAAYTVCVPIISNLKACMDFKASTADY